MNINQRRKQLQISERRLLLMLGDALCNFAAVLIALYVWAWVDGRLNYDLFFVLSNFWWYIILQALWFMLASANDFYDLRLSSSLARSAFALFQITLQMLVVYLVIFFFSPRGSLPRLFVIYYGVLSFILISLWRAWRPFLIGWTSQPRRAVIIGSGWAAREVLEVIDLEAPNEYRIVGIVPSTEAQPEMGQMIPYMQPGERLPDFVQELEASEVILAYDTLMPGEVFASVMDIYESGLTITPMPILFEQITGRVPIEHVGQEYWNVVLPVQSGTFYNPYPLLKRLLDVLVGLVGFLLFLILLPFIALAIFIDSPGPIFFRQERTGKSGRPFKIIKLRTMIRDAEKYTGPKWASEDDPRITRVGRILRKTRLDELPQLMNVLRGEMSLVGPRPERPHFVDQLSEAIPFYRTRHIIKPGVTGWAQVRYGYGNTVEDSLIKLQYDLYYIRHQNLVLDILIMLRTVGKMLRFSGI